MGRSVGSRAQSHQVWVVFRSTSTTFHEPSGWGPSGVWCPLRSLPQLFLEAGRVPYSMQSCSRSHCTCLKNLLDVRVCSCFCDPGDREDPQGTQGS